MVVADLHVHTTRSDGTLAFEDVPRAARQAGVEAVALTDHDRLQPALDDAVAVHDGVILVHGIELRVDAVEQRLDLLGYGVKLTDALVETCKRIQQSRIERGRAIIERVEERLGVSLPVEPRAGLGRPHIARAIADVSKYDFEGAFEHLIGDDGPCYVPREIPSFEQGRDVLTDACGLVGLAHPLRHDDPAAALARCETLDAVERAYPYGHSADRAPVDAAIERFDLVPTGGSDAHGKRLGLDDLDATEWDRVRANIQ